jgi:hypothetical protein
MAAVAGYQANIYITTNGASTTLPGNEVLTDSGDHITYYDPNPARWYWDDGFAPVVQIDTVGDGAHYNTVSASTYTVQYVGGKIIFNSANTAITLVRISSGAKYWPYTTLALGRDWVHDGERQFLETTVFVGPGGSRAKTYIPTLSTSTFQCKLFWADGTYLSDITSGFRCIISGVTPTNNRYEAYAFVKSDKIHPVLAGGVEEDVAFQHTGFWYYN